MSAERPDASERLTLSRERLRLALLRQQAAAPGAATWPDTLWRDLPGSQALWLALKHWWAAQRNTSALLRNPLALAGVAAVLGALLAWCRPWRWLGRAQWADPLVPGLLRAALASGVVQTWILRWLTGASEPADPGHRDL